MKYIDYYTQWYQTYRQNGRRQTTINKYISLKNYLQNSSLGHKEIKKISKMDIQKFLDKYGESRVKSTTFRCYKIIKASLEDAVIDRLIKESPCIRIEINSKEKSYTVAELQAVRNEKKWLEFDEYEKLKMYLLNELKNHLKAAPFSVSKSNYKMQTRLMVIYLALKTGMRFSEILGLTENDIDFENGYLNIDKTYDYKRYVNGFVPTKNLASIRTVAVDGECLKLVKSYLAWANKSNIVFDKGAIFTEHGVNIQNASINNQLGKVLKSLSIERITFHKLRHTHASILIAKGISLQVVAKRLGHTNTNMIQKTYGHLLKSVEMDENEKILKLL